MASAVIRYRRKIRDRYEYFDLNMYSFDALYSAEQEVERLVELLEKDEEINWIECEYRGNTNMDEEEEYRIKYK